ncbi:MAG TPA: hypothetical protein VIV11_33050, partial [Kofleriaceae bacterium]
MKYGPWLERLEALAVGREVVATGGLRDAQGVTTARAHVVPLSLLDDKGTAWSIETEDAVRALAFAGDALLLTGSDDGRVIAWDVTGQRPLVAIGLKAPVRAIAIDSAVARGDAGKIAVGTLDGTLHVLDFAVQGGTPKLTPALQHALSDGAIFAAAFDPSGLLLAGGADGQLYIVQGSTGRTVSPGGDGGIRALACIGDGRAAVGCGDGSLRLCFIVGDVEAQDRSGDHGHLGALRSLALGPVVTDDAGREQPRRIFSAGEDGVVKSWFVDGARRPKTIDVSIGPLTAIAFQSGAPVMVDKRPAVGRLWCASTARKLAALVLGPDVEPFGAAVTFGSQL